MATQPAHNMAHPLFVGMLVTLDPSCYYSTMIDWSPLFLYGYEYLLCDVCVIVPFWFDWQKHAPKGYQSRRLEFRQFDRWSSWSMCLSKGLAPQSPLPHWDTWLTWPARDGLAHWIGKPFVSLPCNRTTTGSTNVGKCCYLEVNPDIIKLAKLHCRDFFALRNMSMIKASFFRDLWKIHKFANSRDIWWFLKIRAMMWSMLESNNWDQEWDPSAIMFQCLLRFADSEGQFVSSGWELCYWRFALNYNSAGYLVQWEDAWTRAPPIPPIPPHS